MKQDIYKNNIPFFFFLFVTTKLLFSSLTFYSLFLLFILYSNFFILYYSKNKILSNSFNNVLPISWIGISFYLLD